MQKLQTKDIANHLAENKEHRLTTELQESLNKSHDLAVGPDKIHY